MTISDSFDSPQGEREECSRLKVALLFDREYQPKWIVSVIETLMQDPFCHIDRALFLCSASDAINSAQRHWFYRAYEWFDARRNADLPDVWTMHSVSRLFQEHRVPMPTIDTYVTTDLISGTPFCSSVSSLPDVALYFGESLRFREVLTRMAHYGVWTLLTDNRTSLLLAAYRAVLNRMVTISAAVWQLETDPVNDHIVAQSTIGVHRFSVRQTEYVLFSKATRLVHHQLHALAHCSEGRIIRKNSIKSASVPEPPVSRSLARLGVEYAKLWLLNRIMPGGWILAYRAGGSPFLDDLNTEPFTILNPPPGFQWADPFPWLYENRHFVFFEEIPPRGTKAHIAVCELTEHKSAGLVVSVAICKDYHLSFPFLFKWQDALFMMPQTMGNNCVEIYRCTMFPNEWEPETQFFEGLTAGDAVLIEMNGFWWLLTYLLEHDVRAHSELFVFFANSPFGPWTAHSLNPVVSDVRHARPAGRIFQHQNRYFRPAQDCSRGYGYAVVLNEILELTPTTYSENPVATILPNWGRYIQGTHTLNHCNGITVIDGFQRIPMLRAFAARRMRNLSRRSRNPLDILTTRGKRNL